MDGASFEQQLKGLMAYPQTGWHRAVFKLPIVLWRMGLGPLLGRGLLLITHTGRKSGLPRRTMVEYHRMDERFYVPCAFGARAQWYRNIEADPFVTIQVGNMTRSARARRVVDDEELLAVYALMRQRNPVMLDWYLQSLDIAPDPECLLDHKDRVYFVTFEPTDVPTPPPLEADLKWVWNVLAALMFLRWVLQPRKKKPA
jgi:deazaflavin-dependent oxidoreductase (nitroreductase family)